MDNPTPVPSATRLRMSLAACALVVATSAADPSTQAAGGACAAVTAAARVSQADLLRKIEAYCTRSWQNAGIARQDWADCTNDVFARLLQRLGQEGLQRAIEDRESEQRRELNRSIWTMAQRWRRSPRLSPLASDDAGPTEHDPWPAKMEALSQVRSAIDSDETRLSPTQRDIVTRWSDGESISSIADTLDLSPARVSDEKYKAIQKLRRHFGCDASV